MSLRKGIIYGKEHRKPYYGSKDFDKTCRNHGGCSWCLENRKYKDIKKIEKMLDKIDEYWYNIDEERKGGKEND